jgi:hypothetical protein
MVRSLLNSTLLTRRSGLRFMLFFLAVSVMLASVPLWLIMADYDYHFAFEGQQDKISFKQKQQTPSYSHLSANKQRIVDAAIDGQSFTFEDDTKTFPEFVYRGGTYYQFDSYRVIDWTYPGTIGPIVVGLVGLWLTVEAVQHERKQLGTPGY